MKEQIFVIDDSNKMIEMNEEPFANEAEFQNLLSQHPNLLPGKQMDRNDPRRFMLISPEVKIKDGTDASDRWSIDHFFVDQDATPTLVEVKRKSDTRIRREVIGQMMEYASNGLKYWKKEDLIRLYESRYQTKEISDKNLVEFVENKYSVEEFWDRVDQNLKTGNVRLLFVADSLPEELIRIIEFLNEQMKDVEVLGIELKHFSEGKNKTIVPRVVGLTSQATERKSASRINNRRRWDQQSFLTAVYENYTNQNDREKIDKLISFAQRYRVNWGNGIQNGSLNVVIPGIGPRSIFSIYTDGEISINPGWFYEEGQEHEREKLNKVGEELSAKYDVRRENSSGRIAFYCLPFGEWAKNPDDIIKAIEGYIGNRA